MPANGSPSDYPIVFPAFSSSSSSSAIEMTYQHWRYSISSQIWLSTICANVRTDQGLEGEQTTKRLGKWRELSNIHWCKTIGFSSMWVPSGWVNRMIESIRRVSLSRPSQILCQHLRETPRKKNQDINRTNCWLPSLDRDIEWVAEELAFSDCSAENKVSLSKTNPYAMIEKRRMKVRRNSRFE